ncbi:MAG: transcription antitermination factor NusB [Candidatus Omnitrophota bacterium]|nr:MAG: transcription antitermination factor NusB [Candidatus Omnitrophota bacterium]
MRKRTRAREISLQILYLIDISEDSYQNAWDKFWAVELKESPELEETEIKEFCWRLVKGTMEKIKEIDEIISKYTENWRLPRIGTVERNVLRLATYELIFCPEIPPIVSIDEAVELAKRYSGLEAGKFVNGILDRIRKGETEGRKKVEGKNER